MLRLRGGGWSLSILINGRELTIDGPPNNMKISKIYDKIYHEYPQLFGLNF